MTIFGLKEAEVAGLVRAVSQWHERDVADESASNRRTSDREAIQERFARSAWSGIAEPGDRVAGELVASLGAGRALAAMLERWSPQALVTALGTTGAPATDLTEDDLAQALARWTPRLSSGPAVVALRQGARFGVRLIVPDDPQWPTGLSDLGAHAPLALWTRGSTRALSALTPSIAIVGARAATGYGEHVTMEASAGLVDRGYAIVSGAAYGVDGMAHRAALASGGQTIAFLAGGVDRYYPSGHDVLLTRIAEHGMVVSELPCGAQPTRWRFLQRNRLIAAASNATIVVEAGWRSGSLNTAHHALSLARPVGAVPGPVTSAASAGCHRLIRESDVTCVTNADEMAELAPLATHVGITSEVHVDPSDPHHIRVLDALSVRSPRELADVAARSGLSVPDVRAALGELELEGRANQNERGWLTRSTAHPA